MYVRGGRPRGCRGRSGPRKPGMMLLIGLAITVAFVASWGEPWASGITSLTSGGAALLIVIMLGHWVEMRSLAQTTPALDLLVALLPDEAEKVEHGEVAIVAPSELKVGDIAIVRPGGQRARRRARIVDGRPPWMSRCHRGIAHQSRRRRPGDGGNRRDGLASASRSPQPAMTRTCRHSTAVSVADVRTRLRAQRSLTPQRDGCSGSRSPQQWSLRVVGVPAARRRCGPYHHGARGRLARISAGLRDSGLSVVSIATEGEGARRGAVKDRFARACEPSTVLFDKTGTLTRGEPSVTEVFAVEDGAHQTSCWRSPPQRKEVLNTHLRRPPRALRRRRV